MELSCCRAVVVSWCRAAALLVLISGGGHDEGLITITDGPVLWKQFIAWHSDLLL